MSNPAFDKISPVRPPTVNKKINPTAKYNGVLKTITPPHKVASQLNILMPVGIAITIVADTKYARVFISIPEVYI
jgi:hypothetical protein